MPKEDGTGPNGQGPMMGRGMGHCVLKVDENNPSSVEGFTGTEGKPIKKEVNKMPAGNGTGPMGMGAMTGRAAGYCAGNLAPGYMNSGMGRGTGHGRGFGPSAGLRTGRGQGRGVGLYGTAPTREKELEMLKSQSEGFQGALQDIQQRISELEKQD